MLHMERAAMLQTRSVAGQLIAETQVIIGDSPHTFLTLQGICTSSKYSSSSSLTFLVDHHKRVASELTCTLRLLPICELRFLHCCL
jgi:hypothetical protein